MAVSGRVQLLNSGSEMISTLVEYLKNPNLISTLEAEVKKLNSLTDDEEKQLHESKILIQQKDQLARDIQQKKADMSAELAAHSKKLSDEAAAAEKMKADALAAVAAEHLKLDQRKAEADEKDTQLRQYDNKLKETAAKIKGLAGA